MFQLTKLLLLFEDLTWTMTASSRGMNSRRFQVEMQHAVFDILVNFYFQIGLDLDMARRIFRFCDTVCSIDKNIIEIFIFFVREIGGKLHLKNSEEHLIVIKEEGLTRL